MALLDSTVVGIALPSIEPHLSRGRRHAAVGRHRLCPHAGRLLAPRRRTGRPLRAPARLRRRRRLVRPRLGGLRPRPGRRLVDRSPSGPRRRRGAPGAGQPGHHPGLVPRRRPRPRHRRLVGVRRLGRGGRPAGGWLPPRGRLVALGLLHQPPARGVGPGRDRPPRARVTGPQQHRPHRHRRRRAGGRVPGRPDLRAHRGAHAGLVEPGRRGQPRPRRRDRPRLRRRRAAVEPSPCSRSSCSAPASSAAPTP